MAIAMLVASRGTCDRAQVGAVIAREGRIISIGYNGAPPGLPHCNTNNHGFGEGWGREPYETGCRNAIHAEANALAFAARYGVSTADATLYVTVSPCLTCAMLLVAAGIERVIYAERYRDTAGLNLLADALVPTIKSHEG